MRLHKPKTELTSFTRRTSVTMAFIMRTCEWLATKTGFLDMTSDKTL